jgi:hypothetical protein
MANISINRHDDCMDRPNLPGPRLGENPTIISWDENEAEDLQSDEPAQESGENPADDALEDEYPPSPFMDAFLGAVSRLIEWIGEPKSDEFWRGAGFIVLFVGFWVSAVLLGHEVWMHNTAYFKNEFMPVRSWFLQRYTPGWVTLAIILGFVAIVYVGRREYRKSRGIKPTPWVLIATCLVAILAVTSTATWLLFREAARAGGEAQASLRFDAVKTAIELFAGSSGAGILLLSFRSHFTSEADRLSSQFDTAVDKLANDNLVIQAGALVTIERLVSKNTYLRSAAGAVIGAYLKDHANENRQLAADIHMRLRLPNR